jgi:murein DD-endopeptidase MepM/ murein hydrolase activator NlpD
MSTKSRRQRRLPHSRSASRSSGSLRLAAVLAVLVGVNLYVFLWRGGTSIPEVRQAAMAAEGPMAPGAGDLDDDTVDPNRPVPEADEAADEQVSDWIEGEVGKGDSLGRILNRHGFDAQQVNEVVRTLQPHMNFRAIRVGQTYRLHSRDGVLDEFEFNVSRVEKVRAARGADGLVGEKLEAETRMEVMPAGGTIKSSLYGAIKAGGEDTRLVAMMVDVFAYDLDFFNDQHPGDTFRLLVEKEYLNDDFLRYHTLRAAEYAGKAGTFRVFHWASKDGKVKGYFNDKGESVAKTFLKTPLKYSRVSSKFDRNRMHPVLHKKRAHLGVDYAAATGTPVWAAAAGRIVSRGYSGGAGNRVVIDHGNGYQTVYMHLSRFRKGQSVGSRIDQKTVIGYVGATGLATGAHLHFSVKKNGGYVDPLKIKMTRNAGVPRAYRGAFLKDVAVLSEKLAAVPTAAKTAEPPETDGDDPDSDGGEADDAE